MSRAGYRTGHINGPLVRPVTGFKKWMHTSVISPAAVRYLITHGIKVGVNMTRIVNWDPVLDVFKRRLAKWKAQVLSIGGRLTLVKSVLQSLPLYYFSLYSAPKKIINDLERLMRNFLWGGIDDVKKLHWVAWEKITIPKNKGGLGITRLEDCNDALILKWLWRYRLEGDVLWKKVIDAIHFKARNWELYPVVRGGGGVWLNIVTRGNRVSVDGSKFTALMQSKIGNGKMTRFWLDPWVGDTPLRIKFPSLYRLENDKLCKVADRLLKQGGITKFAWNWKKVPITQDETIELTGLRNQTSTTILAENADGWNWNGGSDVGFVAAVKRWLSSRYSSSPELTFPWCKWLPSKCNIFFWRAISERIPTKVALAHRNIHVTDLDCPLCREGVETASHLFTGCGLSCSVWEAVAQWCRLPVIYAFDAKDLLSISINSGRSPVYQEAIQGIIIITCWRIWKVRNDFIFKAKEVNRAEIFSDVKSFGFLWYKHRRKDSVCNWDTWCRFALM
ncbi:putative reverse transcriptase zinc-binding domain-containing protein [Helianthus annuus]|uniref:Reverse transcriptase zinc-binding domain-containing protein n=1 Tax=Helianthus annuus TaxID=4232 RepID=A0A9K3J1Q3_HELAN|nr:putative reverse transcriptase zinc-binding domain-containing protein [Helianthus annuus]KAJ0919804.1 putative reverse transcriptase zinc-binding domain-containing protein [Helianthus annuus]